MSSSNNSTTTSSSDSDSNCVYPHELNAQLGLRVGGIFVLLFTSMFGTLFPILVRRSKLLSIPPAAYDVAKYFGSGVIIATAFIHLLVPANESLSSTCLPAGWSVYPWAEGIALISVFVIFLVEVISIRLGTRRLIDLNLKNRPSRGIATDAEVGPSIHIPDSLRPKANVTSSPAAIISSASEKTNVDVVVGSVDFLGSGGDARLIGAFILELGVVFHSAVIGLTLAVNPEFTTFFIVIIFHQTFEGLGLGARLSQLTLPERWQAMPVIAGLIYSFVTPISLAIGLGVRQTYNPNSPTALMVQGCLDAFSAGILLYTGLVELLAHDFIMNKSMLIEASDLQLAGAIISVMAGAGLMALLGRWA
ncbi:hypothetical protein O181_047112 [Austropuccinia psidii MF-1]|uniref:ZIP zinc/iron transport family n=1 Tax=Austropuccinia psidii MF-1 TaxID=1389203 RepID=A0A9Q3DSK1_9BASI|nr:hypothetical protein [Austropuccinia psidii MF-1]